MNVALGMGFAAIATLGYWRIAAAAGSQRGVTIGTLPLLLPFGGAFFAAAGMLDGAPLAVTFAGAALAVAGVVDARSGFVFDRLTGSMLAASLALRAHDGALPGAVLGAIAVGGSLYALHAITRGAGLGLGDVKLGAALGVAFGPAWGLTAIAVAFVFGGAYGAGLIAARRAIRGRTIRFAPYIAAGSFATVLAAAIPSR